MRFVVDISITMGDLGIIAKFLEESVVASTAKSAERNLGSLEGQPGFGLDLLHIVASTNLPLATRLAGASFLQELREEKMDRRRW